MLLSVRPLSVGGQTDAGGGAVPAAVPVDVKADLATLLDEWEEAQQGTTEQLVSILTKSAPLRSFKCL